MAEYISWIIQRMRDIADARRRMRGEGASTDGPSSKFSGDIGIVAALNRLRGPYRPGARGAEDSPGSVRSAKGAEASKLDRVGSTRERTASGRVEASAPGQAGPGRRALAAFFRPKGSGAQGAAASAGGASAGKGSQGSGAEGGSRSGKGSIGGSAQGSSLANPARSGKASTDGGMGQSAPPANPARTGKGSMGGSVGQSAVLANPARSGKGAGAAGSSAAGRGATGTQADAIAAGGTSRSGTGKGAVGGLRGRFSRILSGAAQRYGAGPKGKMQQGGTSESASSADSASAQGQRAVKDAAAARAEVLAQAEAARKAEAEERAKAEAAISWAKEAEAKPVAPHNTMQHSPVTPVEVHILGGPAAGANLQELVFERPVLGTQRDGRYIPYTGGSLGWFENTGVSETEKPSNYQLTAALDAERVRETLKVRARKGRRPSGVDKRSRETSA